MKELKLLNTTKVVLIDDEEYSRILELSLTWGISAGGYVISTDRHKQYGQVRLHRFILGFPSEMVDHVDRNPLNCQKSNLRLCDKSQNAVNTTKKDMSKYLGAKKKSKYKGVYWAWRNSKWLAQIGFESRVIYGGYFENEIDAANKANTLYKKYHGEFAVLNVISP